jgi:hypothetical protein
LCVNAINLCYLSLYYEEQHYVNKIHNEKFNFFKFWCDLNIIIRIECILLKYLWGIKALIELHFQHEAQRFIENVLRSTLSQWNNLKKLNFSLWILFVLDYLLLEITTPLIVYIWRRHGGTMKWSHDYKRDISHPNETPIRTCMCLRDDVRCKQSMA